MKRKRRDEKKDGGGDSPYAGQLGLIVVAHAPL